MAVEWKVEVNGGKYAVVFGTNGSLSAERYGEPWREMTGDNLVYWLAAELQEAREQIKVLKEKKA